MTRVMPAHGVAGRGWRPWALLVVVLGLLVVAAPGRAQAASADTSAAGTVVVVGVPGLVWSDLSPEITPTMLEVADNGAIGVLSVRSVTTLTCPADGWLSLSAGRRAAGAPRPQGGCPIRLPYLTPTVGAAGGTHVAELPEIILDNEHTNDRAVPGTMAERVRCTAAIGQGGALAAATPTGAVGRYLPSLPAADASGAAHLADLLAACPVAVVAAAALEPDPVVRTGALLDVDATVRAVRDAMPADTLLMVLGISEIGPNRPGLHVAMVSGPGFEEGWLTSTSTLHTPYVQLIDAAPTALAALGAGIEELTGKPMHTEPATAAGQDRSGVEDDVRLMAELTRKARLQQDLMGPFDIAWGLSGVAVATVMGVVWARSRRAQPGEDAPTPRRWVAVAAVVGAAYAAVPVATFLANLVPWWTVGSGGADYDVGPPGVVLALAITFWVGVVVAAALGGPWRGSVLGPAALVAFVTAAVIGIDVATGSRLELDSMLGYSPLVAGRFSGMSNMAFAAFAVGALVFLGVAAASRSRPVGLAVLVGGGSVAVLLVATRSAGNDFGGTIALVPAVAVLVVQFLGGRLTWPRIFAALTAAVAVVGVVGLIDYSRPPSERGHVGSFVEDILTGEAWEVMRRKAESLLTVVFATPVTFLVPFVLVGITYLLVRPRGRTVTAVIGTIEQSPPLRECLIACAVCTCIGFAVNDSGVALAGTALGMAVPIALLGVAWTARLRTGPIGR